MLTDSQRGNLKYDTRQKEVESALRHYRGKDKYKGINLLIPEEISR